MQEAGGSAKLPALVHLTLIVIFLTALLYFVKRWMRPTCQGPGGMGETAAQVFESGEADLAYRAK